MSEVEARLRAAGLVLPPTPTPQANYLPAVRAGNLVFLAGHGPVRDGRPVYTGQVGRDVTLEQGYEAARLAALSLLASLKAEIGDLDRVKRVVKVLGMVNSAPEFGDQPRVINGASDVFVTAFGESGRHARSAVGLASLPGRMAVEVEMVVEVDGA